MEDGRMDVRRWAWSLCVVAFLLLGGCQEATQSYVRRSSADPAIMATVANFATAYNQQDMKGLMATFREKAVIVNEGQTNLFPKAEFYKEEFGQAFSETMKRFPKMSLGEPYVFIVLDTGDKAVVALVSDFGGAQVASKFSLQMEGGRWSIVKIRYD